jgi:hypothetical protein
MQEDSSNQVHLAKTWLYDIGKDKLTEVAHHDPDRFVSGAPNSSHKVMNPWASSMPQPSWARASIYWCNKLTILSLMPNS